MGDTEHKNLLFIMYDLDRGGPELRLLDLAEHIPPDMRLFLCVTSTNLSLLDRFKKYVTDIDVVPIRKAYLEIGKLWRITTSVRKNRIDIINTYDLKGLVIALFIKLFSGRKTVLVHHVVDLLHNYRFRQRVALKILLKIADRVITNSHDAMELLAKGYVPASRVELIHNGVDVDKFGKGRIAAATFKDSLGIPPSSRIMGTVANLRREKEYPFLLTAFKHLLGRHQDVQLLCVGGGPLLEEIKELSRDLGIDKKVIFTGYVENVPDHLAIMDLFVLCSSSEGFPNTLIQAMSMEVPVIVTAVGECPEIVDDGSNGFLFAPGDQERFVSTACALMEDQEAAAAIARNGKQKVTATYSLGRMIDHYFEYFRRVAR
jgi:glycosyltransferase involved in cell wall biosynthesis